MASDDFVARTTQLFPAAVGVNVEPDTVHAPDTTLHDTAPVPVPPDEVNTRPVPKVPDVDATTRGVDWAALTIAIVVCALVRSLNAASPAFVAVITQLEPASPGVN